ncbi:biotin/lipoyl-containing protein [Staphylococcus aureus]
MAFESRLPDIGRIDEGEIVKWFVKAGDTIEEDDVLAEVQNDKSVVEIPSPVSGTVEEVMVEEGTVAVVGDVIVKIDAPDAEDMQFKVMMMIHHLKKNLRKRKRQQSKHL